MRFKNLVFFGNKITQSSFLKPFGDKIDMIFLLIINNLMKPDDIWMLKSLKKLQFFYDTIICRLAITTAFLFKHLLVHFLDSEHLMRYSVFA